MKYLFKLKWENIMLVLLAASIMYSLYAVVLTKDILVILISLMTIITFIVVLINYKRIRELRIEVLNVW